MWVEPAPSFSPSAHWETEMANELAELQQHNVRTTEDGDGGAFQPPRAGVRYRIILRKPKRLVVAVSTEYSVIRGHWLWVCSELMPKVQDIIEDEEDLADPDSNSAACMFVVDKFVSLARCENQNAWVPPSSSFPLSSPEINVRLSLPALFNEDNNNNNNNNNNSNNNSSNNNIQLAQTTECIVTPSHQNQPSSSGAKRPILLQTAGNNGEVPSFVVEMTPPTKALASAGSDSAVSTLPQDEHVAPVDVWHQRVSVSRRDSFASAHRMSASPTRPYPSTTSPPAPSSSLTMATPSTDLGSRLSKNDPETCNDSDEIPKRNLPSGLRRSDSGLQTRPRRTRTALNISPQRATMVVAVAPGVRGRRGADSPLATEGKATASGDDDRGADDGTSPLEQQCMMLDDEQVYFSQVFGGLRQETLLHYFSCFLHRSDGRRRGRLYLTAHAVCFHSVRQSTRICIPFSEVVAIVRKEPQVAAATLTSSTASVGCLTSSSASVSASEGGFHPASPQGLRTTANVFIRIDTADRQRFDFDGFVDPTPTYHMLEQMWLMSMDECLKRAKKRAQSPSPANFPSSSVSAPINERFDQTAPPKCMLLLRPPSLARPASISDPPAQKTPTPAPPSEKWRFTKPLPSVPIPSSTTSLPALPVPTPTPEPTTTSSTSAAAAAAATSSSSLSSSSTSVVPDIANPAASLSTLPLTQTSTLPPTSDDQTDITDTPVAHPANSLRSSRNRSNDLTSSQTRQSTFEGDEPAVADDDSNVPALSSFADRRSSGSQLSNTRTSNSSLNRRSISRTVSSSSVFIDKPFVAHSAHNTNSVTASSVAALPVNILSETVAGRTATQRNIEELGENRRLRLLFSLPPSETLIATVPYCTVNICDSSLRGRLYLTPYTLCFRVEVFGRETLLVLPLLYLASHEVDFLARKVTITTRSPYPLVLTMSDLTVIGMNQITSVLMKAKNRLRGCSDGALTSPRSRAAASLPAGHEAFVLDDIVCDSISNYARHFPTDYAAWRAGIRLGVDRHLGNFGMIAGVVRSPHFESLVLSGLPDDLRGQIWMTLSGARHLKDEAARKAEALALRRHATRGIVDRLKETNKPLSWSASAVPSLSSMGRSPVPLPLPYWDIVEKHAGDSSVHTLSIDKDLHRTFPEHPFFRSEEGLASLGRLLHAYSWRNPVSIGYCQSMNIVCSRLRIFLDEEDTFWLLSSVCETMLPRFYNHEPNMFGALVSCRVFEDIFESHLPSLYSQMMDIGVPLCLVSLPWFLCIFQDCLPLETAFRVLDCFFYYGVRALYSIGLAVLHLSSEVIMEAEGPELVHDLKCVDIPSAVLIQVAFERFPISERKAVKMQRAHTSRLIKNMKLHHIHGVTSEERPAAAAAKLSPRTDLVSQVHVVRVQDTKPMRPVSKDTNKGCDDGHCASAADDDAGHEPGVLDAIFAIAKNTSISSIRKARQRRQQPPKRRGVFVRSENVATTSSDSYDQQQQQHGKISMFGRAARYKTRTQSTQSDPVRSRGQPTVDGDTSPPLNLSDGWVKVSPALDRNATTSPSNDTSLFLMDPDTPPSPEMPSTAHDDEEKRVGDGTRTPSPLPYASEPNGIASPQPALGGIDLREAFSGLETTDTLNTSTASAPSKEELERTVAAAEFGRSTTSVSPRLPPPPRSPTSGRRAAFVQQRKFVSCRSMTVPGNIELPEKGDGVNEDTLNDGHLYYNHKARLKLNRGTSLFLQAGRYDGEDGDDAHSRLAQSVPHYPEFLDDPTGRKAALASSSMAPIFDYVQRFIIDKDVRRDDAGPAVVYTEDK